MESTAVSDPVVNPQCLAEAYMDTEFVTQPQSQSVALWPREDLRLVRLAWRPRVGITLRRRWERGKQLAHFWLEDLALDLEIVTLTPITRRHIRAPNRQTSSILEVIPSRRMQLTTSDSTTSDCAPKTTEELV